MAGRFFLAVGSHPRMINQEVSPVEPLSKGKFFATDRPSVMLLDDAGHFGRCDGAVTDRAHVGADLVAL
jgi:hypothetical protein